MLLRKLHLAVLVLVGSAVCSSQGWAQTVKPYATAEGAVTDQYNTPIAGVAVLITNGGTYKVSTVTDKNGNYVLKNIHRYVGSTQTLVTYNILVSGAAINSYKSGAITFPDDFNLVLQDNISIPTYTSEFLTDQAWTAYAQGNLNLVLTYTNECIYLYSPQALQMEANLSAYPTGKANIFTYWALNDVATSYYIQGLAYYKAKMKDQGVLAYLTVINDYYYAQTYNPSGGGFFWKPAAAALTTLGLENYKTFYNAALTAIKNYQKETITTKLPGDLSLAVKAVTALQKFNQILTSPTGPGLYDYAWSLLNQAVQVNVAKGNNIYTLTGNSAPSIYTNFFGQNIKADDLGNIFVYASSISTPNSGMIYEFLKAGGPTVAVGPVSSMFAVKGNLLAAITSPSSSSDGVVNIYTYQNNAWDQVNSIDITILAKEEFPGISSTNATQISNIVLSNKALVVTLTGGYYLVFNNYSVSLPQNPFSISYAGQLGNSTLSADADGSYVVIGGSVAGTAIVLQAKSTNTANTVWNWVKVYQKTVTNDAGFGLSVAIQAPEASNQVKVVAVAVGSFDNIYLLVNPETSAVSFKTLLLFMPSTGSLTGQNKLAMKSNFLVVPYTYSQALDYNGKPIYTSAAMVYSLNTSNVWAWGYSQDGAGFSNRIPSNVETRNQVLVLAPEGVNSQGFGEVFVVSPK